MSREREDKQNTPKGLSLSTQVILGLVLGIAAGVFFGELAAPVGIVGDAFIRLLQMTVLPYLIFSLVVGLGSLEPREARAMAVCGGTVLLLLWGLALVVVVLLPLAFPEFTSASFFSTRLIEERKSFDFLGMYIPANPFFALGHNAVPAVVLFSVVLGVALMGLPDKQRLIGPLEVMVGVITRVTSFVAKLAPYGVFALVARAVGTLGGEELERLQVYVVSFAAAALLMTFWFLPGVVTSLTSLRYWDVLGRTRDALVTAFATGNLLIVLPILARESKLILRDHALDDEEVDSAVDVVVPASYNFPSAGKLLGLSFLPFGAWFVDTQVRPGQVLQLFSTGPLSFFGQTSVAIPLLLDLMELPADLFELFLAVDVVTGRFGVLLGAMHILALALVCPWAMQRGFTVRWKALLRFALASVVITAVVLLGTRVLLSRTLALETTTYRSFVGMDLRLPSVRAKLVQEAPVPAPGDGGRPRLEAIAQRGTLRVGYFRDSLPYAFLNAAGRLVGHDVDVAHQLARDLGVSLEFVRIERSEMAQRLADRTCDILMSGVAVTPERSREMTLSVPYMDNALAFLVEDHRRHEFASWEKLRKLDDLRIAVPGLPYYMALMQELLPNATLIPVDSLRGFFRGERDDVDAAVFGAESGAAWTMIYPAYSVVVPKPKPLKVPLVYCMPRRDGEWADYVNTWLELKRRDNTLDALYEHWILGKAAASTEPRWSVVRDVLGWVE